MGACISNEVREKEAKDGDGTECHDRKNGTTGSGVLKDGTKN